MAAEQPAPAEVPSEEEQDRGDQEHDREGESPPDANWSPLRKFLHSVIVSTRFDMALGAVIMFNIYLVIVETDATAIKERFPDWVNDMNNVLLSIYSSEICVRVFVQRCKFCRDAWNIMDFLVVGLDLVMLVLNLLLGKMPRVAILRIFRLVKLARAYKVLRTFPELHLMMKGLVGAMSSIFWGMLLTVIVLVIWSILAVQLIHPVNEEVTLRGFYDGTCERCPRAFESVYQSFITFVQQVVAGDSWGLVSVPICEHFPPAVLFFAGVLVSVQLAILNLILAAIVDCAMEARKGSLHEIAVAKAKQFEHAKAKLIRLCAQLDRDKSGKLTLDELYVGIDSSEEFHDTLQVMDISKEDIHVLFGMMDSDSSGDVDFKEFVQQLYNMRSQETNITLMYIKFYVNEMLIRMEENKLFQAEVLGRLKQLELAQEQKDHPSSLPVVAVPTDAKLATAPPVPAEEKKNTTTNASSNNDFSNHSRSSFSSELETQLEGLKRELFEKLEDMSRRSENYLQKLGSVNGAHQPRVSESNDLDRYRQAGFEPAERDKGAHRAGPATSKSSVRQESPGFAIRKANAVNLQLLHLPPNKEGDRSPRQSSPRPSRTL
eukprot:gnl/TRDRNA2_/TRDRNA2_68251_c0_seq1.p1 gnl/TRDRNA2_/TRDRNA2_68251_c0~~gnl/TRDRNA2_/TRDRNA2_68251_c0_seq1.p1  ORF type:complete len:625 (+),score=120.57 gnl/TRDRNA2_/TRDRNA2_68251_c0_seq1:67-1875(+)